MWLHFYGSRKEKLCYLMQPLFLEERSAFVLVFLVSEEITSDGGGSELLHWKNGHVGTKIFSSLLSFSSYAGRIETEKKANTLLTLFDKNPSSLSKQEAS